MMSGIASLVQGDSKKPATRLWFIHLLGATIGGVLSVTVLWMLAAPIRSLVPLWAAIAMTSIVAIASILSDLRVVSLKGSERQVNRSWTRQFGAVGGYFRFGLMLGAGLLTFVPFAVLFSTFTLASTMLSLPSAAAVGALYGLGRTLLVGPGAALPSNPSTLLPTLLARSHMALPRVSALLSLLLLILILGML